MKLIHVYEYLKYKFGLKKKNIKTYLLKYLAKLEVFSMACSKFHLFGRFCFSNGESTTSSESYQTVCSSFQLTAKTKFLQKKQNNIIVEPVFSNTIKWSPCIEQSMVKELWIGESC